ncbi:DUF6428 family protein [Cognatishimia sp. 1_MG-2023]|uniref:DUF6428 family protein n=1 Tax=Cognatishimia sp. 1_MG-2023 TaxID=3062642 RepID=UPI0026E1F5A4|nr:DUF6428 family protein [Cognatishimia sp. 1_MG-2023]MDO6727502.1 DUF6428 family protein [Cognatishimia sp. 1_MG-2023]
MKALPMSLENLLTLLGEKSSAAPLIFSTKDGDIGGGYHVTELKSAKITSIDCGGNVADWTEATLQLLDGGDGTHMTVSKFSAILSHSLKTIPALKDAPLYAEYAPQNTQLSRYDVSLQQTDNSMAEIRLTDMQALCKPAQNQSCGPKCGPTAPQKRACC